MENIVLSIDGENVSCPPESTILNAAERRGIKIPTLCHHPDLKPFGACRICMVEDENTGRLMASCVTPVAPNMAIRTDSPGIKQHRRNIVRLMMAEHPESCVVCSKGNRCRLRNIAAQLGIGETNLYTMINYKTLEQANPFIIRDLSKCILCGKCIRADHELVVVGAIDYNLRGFKSRPSTVYDLPLDNSNCTFCGTCVYMCPTGALSTKNTQYVGTPERESFSICGFCGVGCSLSMGVVGNLITEVNPSHLQDTVNGATLCVRGHFAHDYLNAGDRLTSPLIRKNGNRKEDQLISTSWDEALESVTNRLLEIKKKNGPQSIAFLGSSKCTNEENYLFQKIARLFFETNNVDNGGYLSGQSLLRHIELMTDGGGRIRPLAGLKESEAIFVIGADLSHSVPVLSYYLKRATQKGIPLIIADPRRTELVDFSSLRLPLTPQSDLELINGIAAILNEEETYDRSFIYRHTENFNRYRSALSHLNLGKISKVTGLEIGLMKEAAGLLKRKRIAFIVGHGILQQKYGVQSMEALLNLSLFTGSLGCEGAGLYIVPKENNHFGAWDMGAVPDALPGRQSLKDDSARKKWEQAWKVNISPNPGLNMVCVIEEAEKGNLKALYILGENPLRSLPNSDRVQKALEKLDFIVVQDILNGETARIADVVLPGAAFAEKGGSFTNIEGKIQSFSPVVPPPGDARPDWEILSLLAAKMGHSEPYNELESIRAEIRHLVPMYAQLTKDGHGWIMESSQRSLFHADEQGSLIPFSPVVSIEDEVPDVDYPFTAILGSSRYHLGSGTRTFYSDRIKSFDLKGEIEISPENAEKLDLHDGDTVRVISRHGSVIRGFRVINGLSPKLIFVPLVFNGNSAMNLIGLTQLGKPDSPGWKTCRIKLEKV